MNTNPKFVYVTVISTTPDKLWAAITNPDFTEQYWGGVRAESDFKVGSPLILRHHGEVLHEDKILKSEPPRLLSYSFHPLMHEDMRAEKPSRVTFKIEDCEVKAGQQPAVRLTVTHDEFPEGSVVLPKISNGWPHILSSLKTLLETGRAIEFDW